VIEGGALSAEDRAAITISAVAVDPVVGAPRGIKQSTVEADGRFELRGLLGSRAIRATDLPSGWMLKSVTLAGKDVTDIAIALGGTEQLNAPASRRG
jgi:hypothetical protein